MGSISARDKTGAVAWTSACAPCVGRPADRSCLRSRVSRPGRYFRLMEGRGMMDLPLGGCPDGARTIPELRRAYGWRRARPGVAAAGVLPHPGAPRRIQLLLNDSDVRSPPL